jgi:hypothetical protein
LGIPLPFAGEFEVVIMIGVVTEEMHGSDCVKKRGKARAEQKMKVVLGAADKTAHLER